MFDSSLVFHAIHSSPTLDAVGVAQELAACIPGSFILLCNQSRGRLTVRHI